MGQLGNPSHLDTGRIVVPAAALAGYGAGWLVWRLVPSATVWLALAVGLAVCGLVAWWLARRFETRRSARLDRERTARRAAQIAETESQIAAMRAREDAV